MNEFAQSVGVMALLFVGSMTVAYGLTVLLRPSRLRVPFEEGSWARVVAPGGSYRTRFVGVRRNGLAFEAPLEQDRYVPIRPNTSVLLQVVHAEGLFCFRSRVTDRELALHQFTVERPARFKHIDRRGEPREWLGGSEGMLDGALARFLDLSAGGAKIVCPARVKPGDIVELVLPCEVRVGAHVLGVTDAQSHRTADREIRVQFIRRV